MSAERIESENIIPATNDFLRDVAILSRELNNIPYVVSNGIILQYRDRISKDIRGWYIGQNVCTGNINPRIGEIVHTDDWSELFEEIQLGILSALIDVLAIQERRPISTGEEKELSDSSRIARAFTTIHELLQRLRFLLAYCTHPDMRTRVIAISKREESIMMAIRDEGQETIIDVKPDIECISGSEALHILQQICEVLETSTNDRWNIEELTDFLEKPDSHVVIMRKLDSIIGFILCTMSKYDITVEEPVFDLSYDVESVRINALSHLQKFLNNEREELRFIAPTMSAYQEKLFTQCGFEIDAKESNLGIDSYVLHKVGCPMPTQAKLDVINLGYGIQRLMETGKWKLTAPHGFESEE